MIGKTAPTAECCAGCCRLVPAPEELPEPGSDGAQLLDRYCTACHYLPSPAMHTPGRWPGIVERMARRMVIACITNTAQG